MILCVSFHMCCFILIKEPTFSFLALRSWHSHPVAAFGKKNIVIKHWDAFLEIFSNAQSLTMD